MKSLFSNPLLRGYPLSYKSHATVCITLGLLMTYHPSLLLTSPLWINLHQLFGLTYVPPSRTYPLSNILSTSELQHWSNIGLLITAIGLINIAVASPPGGWAMARELSNLRAAAAVLTLAVWIIKPDSRDLVKTLVLLEDGIGGLITSWQMAR